MHNSHFITERIYRYENTVVGQFFGHTHSDQFSVFYDNADYKDRPTNIMYIAPSVTTFSWRTPTYRVYTVDAVSFEVLDHETYMLNLTEANETNKTEWILEYSAKVPIICLNLNNDLTINLWILGRIWFAIFIPCRLE